MSSLHHSHLLGEGPEPVKGNGSTPAPARGTSRRPAQEKASKVPTQRQGKAQLNGTAPTIADGSTLTSSVSTSRAAGRKSTVPAAGTLTARAKAAAATKAAATKKAASARAATATAATVKAASARAASAKAATSKAATAARAAAAAKVSNRATSARPAAAKPTAAKPTAAKATPAAAKPNAAKPTAAKATPAAAKPAAAKATPPAKPAAAKAPAAKPAAAKATTARPTPYKRPEPVESAPAAVVVEGAPSVDVESSETKATDFLANEIVASVAEGRRKSFLRRRPPSIRRRPSLYLAAALVGAISVSGFSSGDPGAQALENVSHSVSVAEELGITAEPTEAITDTDAAERLGELAVSRNERDAEQAAAAQVQYAADQTAAAAAAAAAAEAARPDAVLPVTGARLTSTFGARWGTLHAGIDLAAPMRTPEMAVMDGVVLEAGPASGFGLAVYIQHENGDVTVYGHMDEILVEAGQVVRAGDTIALLGNRGQSTGPHLHFEVHVGGLNGEKIDPLPWLRERGVAI